MDAFRYSIKSRTFCIENVPIPEPQEKQILVKVEAAGLCASDHHIISHHGDLFLTVDDKITLGHEVAGTVVKLGPGVTSVQIGARIANALKSHPTKEAVPSTAIGLGYDGGYAEFVIMHEEFAIPIPDNVTFAEAAVAADSITTAYHAVVIEGRVNKGCTVAVIGLGGLGLNAVAVAALQGAKVFGVDISNARFETAIAMGAKACATSLSDFNQVQFDVILDFAGMGKTTADAIEAVSLGGVVVIVGLGVDTTSISTRTLILKNATLRGSIGGSISEFREVLALISEKQIKPHVKEVTFASIKENLMRIGEGKVTGRLYCSP
ncbi:chaperonin 10-like protein, partial [Boeremia exigua]|uniref:chaperonin 10-like protein n=1 Tax=Boeremia exigua TaxID=749465 RepID=UPI001E8D90F9